VDGFVEGNGWAMFSCQYKPPLIDMAKMRNKDGGLRFPFLPNEEALSKMSEEALHKIPLASAQVMLDNKE
jgi:hypothetical protein